MSGVIRSGVATLRSLPESVTLQTWKGRYVGGKDSVAASATYPTMGERFRVHQMGEGQVALENHAGSFLSARGGEECYRVTLASQPGESELFTAEAHGVNEVAFRTCFGRYLQAERPSCWNFEVNGRPLLVGPWERFRLQDADKEPPKGSLSFSVSNFINRERALQGPKPWQDGIFSLSHLMYIYGHSLPVVSIAEELPPLNILGYSALPLPTPAKYAADLLSRFEPSASYCFHTTFDFVKKLLAEGKPVLAALYSGEDESTPIPVVRWVLLSGFDDANEQVSFYDCTEGGSGSMDYATFLSRWRWEGYCGWEEEERDPLSLFQAIDKYYQRSSILWIDRPASLQLNGTNIEELRAFLPPRQNPSLIRRFPNIKSERLEFIYRDFRKQAGEMLSAKSSELFSDFGTFCKTNAFSSQTIAIAFKTRV